MISISAPEFLCIYNMDFSKQTFNFLNSVNKTVSNEDITTTIDLTKVEYITASASLILFAIVNTAQLSSSNPSHIKFLLPKNEDGNNTGYQLIVKTGLSKALFAHNFTKVQGLQDDNRFFQSSDTPHSAVIATKKLLEKVSGSNIPLDLMQRIEIAMSEAMLNVSHHSYEHQAGKNLQKIIGTRWWQCAWSVDNPEDNSKEVYFLIFDLGQGVIKSYTGITNLTGVQSSAPFQLEKLRDAMSVGNTRFGVDSGRGNGSEDIKHPTKSPKELTSCIESELSVFSYNCIYNTNNISLKEKENVYWSDLALPGTLLEWKFTIKPE